MHFVLAGIMLSHFSAYLATARYAQDPRATKLLLWSVFLLDVANVALHFEGTYHCQSFFRPSIPTADPEWQGEGVGSRAGNPSQGVWARVAER